MKIIWSMINLEVPRPTASTKVYTHIKEKASEMDKILWEISMVQYNLKNEKDNRILVSKK